MRARVLFFGLLKDVVGTASEESDFPEGADLGAVFNAYASRHPRLRQLASSIVVARNQEFAGLTTPIAEGDEMVTRSLQSCAMAGAKSSAVPQPIGFSKPKSPILSRYP